MSKTNNNGIRSGGAFGWFFQRITGAVLLITLLVHFWVLHFHPTGEFGEITYDIVMQRLSSPLWKTLDLIFLVFGLYHGMNGVILVVNDYLRNSTVRVVLIGLLWVAAIWFLIIGSMTILSLKGITG